MTSILLSMAFAADLTESNISATSLGVQYLQAPALRELDGAKTDDLDVLLSQRLRWTIVQNDHFAVRARMLGRFTLSPGADNFFKRNRVRQLGLSLLTPKWTLDIGRHAVFNGGPRLVDGLQFRLHPSSVLDVGVWGGALPDVFTSDPRFNRFGGGPLVALTLSRVQASVVGEFAVAPGGIDRVAVLLQARLSAARTVEVSGRADLELVGAYGLHLSDAQVFGRWSPTKALRVDLTYNAFSSYTYVNTQAIDPDLQRFAVRYAQGNPKLPALLADCVEPNLAHLAGGTVRFHPKTDGIAPLVRLDGRYRFGADTELPAPDDTPVCVLDDINQFVRLHPAVGVTGLPVGGALDVTLDGNYYSIEGRSQMDAGLSVYWEPVDTGVLAIDASYRLLLNGYDGVKNPLGYQALGTPDEAALGHYSDLFVDVVVPPVDVTVGAGLNVVFEPGDLAEDLGISTFFRATKYLRKRKKKR